MRHPLFGAAILAIVASACSGVQGGSPVAPSASGVASTSETSGGNGPAGNPVGPVTGISLSDDPATDLRANVGADFYAGGRKVELSWREGSRGTLTPPRYTVTIIRVNGGSFTTVYKVNAADDVLRGGLWHREVHLKPGTYRFNVLRENVTNGGAFSSQGDRSRDVTFTVEEGPDHNITADCHYLGDGVWQPAGCGGSE